MKKLCSCILCIILVCVSITSLAVPMFPPMVNSYLDSDVINTAITLSVNELIPFTESRITQMNDFLSNLTLNLSLNKAETNITLNVANNTVFTLNEQTINNTNKLTTSLLPKRILESNTSPIDVLLLNNQSNTIPLETFDSTFANTQFNPSLAFEQLSQHYTNLTDAISSYGDEKKANYNIDDIGRASWRRLATLTTENAKTLSPLIATLLGYGLDTQTQAFISSLSYKDGLKIALYQSEEKGTDMAVYIKGEVLTPDEVVRTLAFQWGFKTKNDVTTNIYSLNLATKKRPYEELKITAEYNTTKDNSETIEEGKSTVLRKKSSIRFTTNIASNLTGNKDKGLINGEYTLTNNFENGDYKLTEIDYYAPTLNIVDNILSGTLTVSNQKNKNMQYSLTFNFNELLENSNIASELNEETTNSNASSSFSQNIDTLLTLQTPTNSATPPLGLTHYNIPTKDETVILDKLSKEQLFALQDEIAQRLAGSILLNLPSLPSSATAFIADGIANEDFQNWLNTVTP